MTHPTYTIGLDYGTASVRAAVFDTADGRQVASHVFEYPRFAAGRYCDPARSQYRQHPQDYLDGMRASIVGALDAAPAGTREGVVAISVDTTGSTPVAVDRAGTPLSLLPEFAEEPDAMFFLWKDHTATAESDAINAHGRDWAEQHGEDYLRFVGGIYSPEWYWAKSLRALRSQGVDSAFADTCYTFVEHADWMPFVLTGGTAADGIKRGVCQAGHKGLFAEAFGGFPPEEFFTALDPALAGFAGRLPSVTYTAADSAGTLSAHWAEVFGLSTDVHVGVGALDAHMGAVGGQIRRGYMTKVMGTSTCDMMAVAPEELGDRLIPGISGQVPGSILPGLVGLEAGQSAFGDAFAWFERLVMWSPSGKTRGDASLRELGEAAGAVEVTEQSEYAVEWLNGRRTPDADPHATGALLGLTLGSDAPRMYRALVEATCFGALAIVERFRESGVRVDGIIGVGGVAQKSPFAMQLMADVLGMPIEVHASDQTAAAGAAMCAATVAGVFPSVEAAMARMGAGFAHTYTPDAAKAQLYRRRYARYRELAAAVG